MSRGSRASSTARSTACASCVCRGNRFRVELVDPVDCRATREGHIDIQAATQKIMSVIEGWVREHPEQWLWLHRRWR